MSGFREALESFYARRRGSGEPGWVAPLREQAYRKFGELGFPTRRTELWKYVNLNPVVKTPFEPGNGAGLKASPASKMLPIGEALKSRRRELEPLLLGRLENEDNPFSAINAFSFDSGYFLPVPAGEKLSAPAEVSFRGAAAGGPPRASHPRIAVILEEGAQACLILNQQSAAAGQNLVNSVADISLGRGARLQLVLLQREPEGTTQLFDARVAQQAESRFEALIISRGGALIRNGFSIELEGEGAFASLHGLALLSGSSQVFNHVAVEHRVPRCTSRQIFKHVLDGRSAAEFTSTVHVARGADGSDSDQLDKNLLLSDDAAVYSRPRLKIDADDVKATHGAATGQMAAAELFYLRSRGLDDKLARTVLTFGFAEEIIEKIPFPALRGDVSRWAHTELGRMLGESK